MLKMTDFLNEIGRLCAIGIFDEAILTVRPIKTAQELAYCRRGETDWDCLSDRGRGMPCIAKGFTDASETSSVCWI
jgi:hypothetical protein